ncbi:beta-1,3-galactosyltransferase 1-like [Watersipora subatra]|uniref:beta-1,3-galactosyltransferase 1-like n=1 Tax=Watersipora subatra TaxID=2589382 RepID=UPI00355C4C2C
MGKMDLIALIKTTSHIIIVLFCVECIIAGALPTYSNSTNATEAEAIEDVEAINPYNYSYILQSDPCTSEVDLLIVIHTSAKLVYSNRRMVMRASWLNRNFLSNKLGLKTKIVFFVGKADTEESQLRMEYESEHYRDIVQSDFTDEYRHNTYKAMSYLRWTSVYCKTASLLMKLDDDTLLKVLRLPSLRSKIKDFVDSKKPIYAGKSIDSIPNRHKHSKWYVSKEVWPEDTYPTWFQGLVYFLSPQHTAELFETALHTHYMHTDDVFIGILVSKTESIRPYTTALSSFSEFALEGFDVVKKLKPKWNKGSSIFFHMPELKPYYLWALEDLRQAETPDIPWFQR